MFTGSRDWDPGILQAIVQPTKRSTQANVSLYFCGRYKCLIFSAQFFGRVGNDCLFPPPVTFSFAESKISMSFDSVVEVKTPALIDDFDKFIVHLKIKII